MKSIALVQTQDRNINQLQQNISQAVNPLLANPPNNSTLINGVALTVGTNVIPIGLTQPLQGWIIIGGNASWDVFDQQTNNPNPSKTLILVSATAVTVNLMVF